jgi:hypothetical protein
LNLTLNAQANVLTVAEAEALTNANRIPIKTAVDTYLEQKSGKAKKTVAQCRLKLALHPSRATFRRLPG